MTCVVADIVENPQQSEPQIVGAAATDRLVQVRRQLDALAEDTPSASPNNPAPATDDARDEDDSFLRRGRRYRRRH